MPIDLKNKSGQSLIELLVAMGVFILVISSTMFLTLDSHLANRQGGERTKAAFFAEAGLSGASSIANQAWKFLTDGEHGLDYSGGYWQWQGNSDILDGRFVRRLSVEPVYRDAAGEIAATGGTIDFDTKKISSLVTWDFTTSRPSEVLVAAYLTNWRSKKWRQSAEDEFKAGTVSQTAVVDEQGGEVELLPSPSVSYYDWDFSDPGGYSYDPNKIEVIASTAQLVSQSVIASGGTVNPDFSTTELPWIYSDWDEDTGEINVTGDRRNAGGNPGGYYLIDFPKGSNDQVGGFIEQSFAVTESDSSAGRVVFDYNVSAFSGQPVSLEIFAWLDSVSGEPLHGTEIWRSGLITGTADWVSVSVDITDKITATGTYYLKLGAWLVTGSARVGKFDIGFDNASADWEKSLGASYPVDNPSIYPAVSFVPENLVAWQSFEETAVKNSGEIYYQLSDDDGATWQYWSGGSWQIAGPADYNTAAAVNDNIASFPALTGRIMFKAFLSSGGAEQIILDNLRLGAETLTGVGYSTYGTYQSTPFDTGQPAVFYNYLDWTAETPNNTDIKFQLRTADTAENLSSADWLGPDGTSLSFYTDQGTVINHDLLVGNRRWIQYQAYLTSDGAATPILYDTAIDYE